MDHKEQIEQSILKGDLSSAISELLRYTKINGQKELHGPLVIQSARFNQNENDNLAGLLSPQDYQRTKNQITVAISSILEKYEQNPISADNKKRKYFQYPITGLVLSIIIIVLIINILQTNSDIKQAIKVAAPTVKAVPDDIKIDVDKNAAGKDSITKKIVAPGKAEIVKLRLLKDANPKDKTIQDATKIAGPQMANIKLIVKPKYSNAQIFVDDVPAQIIENTLLVKTIRVELDKNHVFKFVSDNGSCETPAIFVTADNQKIASCN